MRYIRPIFYDAFCCTAEKCPDTCCAGWQVVIDEESLNRYADAKGEFGMRLRNSIDWQEGCFYQYNKRCAFLNEKNLCDLYAVLGSDALCDTCRKYPRHVEEYEGLREWSLSLSCPKAAEMILTQQGFPEFIVEEDDKEDELKEEFEDFDLLLFTQLEDARNIIFQKLREDAAASCSYVHKNMECALALAREMQIRLEEGRFFEMEELIGKYQEKRSLPAVMVSQGEGCEKTSDVCFDRQQEYQKSLELYHIMYGLERLCPEWTEVLEEMYHTLYAAGAEHYYRIKQDFEAYLAEDVQCRYQWENVGLQLFVFFVYTYFCGAVYDDWIYSKMALAVHSVEFIRELFVARWRQTGKLSMQDYVELSYRYARETEHSDQNLNELEEVFAEQI